jgi:hypothetical protein
VSGTVFTTDYLINSYDKPSSIAETASSFRPPFLEEVCSLFSGCCFISLLFRRPPSPTIATVEHMVDKAAFGDPQGTSHNRRFNSSQDGGQGKKLADSLSPPYHDVNVLLASCYENGS